MGMKQQRSFFLFISLLFLICGYCPWWGDTPHFNQIFACKSKQKMSQARRVSHVGSPLHFMKSIHVAKFKTWHFTTTQRGLCSAFITLKMYCPFQWLNKLLSKPPPRKVSTPPSEKVQIGPTVSMFCVATIIIHYCLHRLEQKDHHQKVTGFQWSVWL